MGQHIKYLNTRLFRFQQCFNHFDPGPLSANPTRKTRLTAARRAWAARYLLPECGIKKTRSVQTAVQNRVNQRTGEKAEKRVGKNRENDKVKVSG